VSIDNHDFSPSLNYSIGVIGSAALVNNILEKIQITVPAEVTRNLDLAYQRNVAGLWDISTQRVNHPLGKYAVSGAIIFESWGDRLVNKTAVAPGLPNVYRVHANVLGKNGVDGKQVQIKEIRLHYTADGGTSWGEVFPRIVCRAAVCDRWWTWMPTTSGKFLLSAIILYDRDVACGTTTCQACSGNPYVVYPVSGFEFCGESDRLNVNVLSSPPAPTSFPPPVVGEDLYVYRNDGTILDFEGKTMPSGVEDWGYTYINWSVPENYGDYFFAAQLARYVYFTYYSGAGRLFCSDTCTAGASNFYHFLFGDALYAMLLSNRSSFNPEEGPSIPGDFTGDGKVDIADIQWLIGSWSTYSPFDYNSTVSHYGKSKN